MAIKVLFDHQTFSLQKFGGISRYFCELMKNLPEDIVYQNSGLFSNNIYIQENFKGLYKEFFPQKEFIGKRTMINFPNKIDSLIKCSTSNYDVFHPTYYDHYFLKINKKPFVLTVHDLAHEKFPLLFKNDPALEFKKQIIYKADHIIAISEFTKKELLLFYNKLNPDRISVIHHGSSLSLKKGILLTNKENYLLFTGSRAGYKNFDFLIVAISSLLIKYDIKLICTGSPFSMQELILFKENKILDFVLHQYVSDDELFSLYSNALAFLFPSFYEGFGIPILEAFEASCPLVLSNSSCFPEIAGDAALYFDPHNATEINQSVERIITDLNLRETLVQKGKERLQLFNWSQTALLTSKVYEKLV
ncbi:MAG: glycosyltransferase family 1 protein [Bacteroidota bacterium]